MREFGRDLGWAVRMWRVDGRLFTAGMGVAVTEAVLFALARSRSTWVSVVCGLAALAWLVFTAGFLGAERVWYDDLGVGRTLSWARVRQLNGDLRRRFVVLGLWILVPTTVAFALTKRAAWPIRLGLTGIVWLAIDVFITFATVQLSFSTSDVSEAIRDGKRMLREQWPRCAPYALIPPLAVQSILQFGNGLGILPRLVGAILVAPLALASRGAVVRYYDRECRVIHMHATADS